MRPFTTNNMKHYIGVDIGLKGGMSIINEKKTLVHTTPIPTREVLVGKKIRNQYNINDISYIIKCWASDYEVASAGMERLRAIPNQSSQTAFSMGAGSMLFKAIFTFWSVPFLEFEPRAWQQKIFKTQGIQYNAKTTKQASIMACSQLWPQERFLATPRSRVPSDGMTDSACIALYTKINDEL
jgi:hypothetical protein